MSHFDHLSKHVPDLSSRAILDVGSGRGPFLIEAALRGAEVIGVEPHAPYRAVTQDRARDAGVSVTVLEGVAEAIPTEDASVGFVNASEIIEHIENPKRALKEIHRVLKPGGYAYVSIPNRFGVHDPHYHMYFVNWLPRAWVHPLIRLCGREKRVTPGTGRQLLTDMHYMTLTEATHLIESVGFSVVDSRELTVRSRFKGIVQLCALLAYRTLRPFYFDTFHFLLQKPSA